MKDKASRLGASLIYIGFLLLVLRFTSHFMIAWLIFFMGICTLLALLTMFDLSLEEAVKVERA